MMMSLGKTVYLENIWRGRSLKASEFVVIIIINIIIYFISVFWTYN